MAERRPRRAGPVWLWVVGLVLLIVLIWLAIDFVTVEEEPALPPAVEEVRGASGTAPAADLGAVRIAAVSRHSAQRKEAA